MSERQGAEDTQLVEDLRDAVTRWGGPMIEDADTTSECEVQVFVYFPEVPACSLAGSFLCKGDEFRAVIAHGPAVALLGEGNEAFFPYAIVRRPQGDGLDMVYCFPVDGGMLVHVLLPDSDDIEAHQLLLEIDSEVPGYAALYFEEAA